MAAKEVLPGLFAIKLGPVNAFLIDEGLTLIDSGLPKNAAEIEEAIRSIGRAPEDLTSIVLTHAHPDHLGSAAHLSGGTIPVAIHGDDIAAGKASLVKVGRPDFEIAVFGHGRPITSGASNKFAQKFG